MTQEKSPTGERKGQEPPTERQLKKRIFIGTSVVFILSIIQYAFPKLQINDPSIWFFVWMFTLWLVWMVWVYFRWRSAADPDFSGLRYSAMLGLAILGVIGVFMLGAVRMYLRESSLQGKVAIITVYLVILMIPVVGLGWTEVWEKFKDPYQFLAKYCACIQAALLIMILSTSTVVSERSVTLFKLVLSYPAKYLDVSLYIFIALMLFGIYLSNVGIDSRIMKFSGILALSNLIICSSIMLHYDEDVMGLAFILSSFFLSMIGMFPQLYWAFDSRKKSRVPFDSKFNHILEMCTRA